MDRRYYQRAKVGVESLFFIEGNGPGLRDFEGILEDISEGGIRILVRKEQYKESVETIKVGSIISFQACDEYQMYNKTMTEIFMGKVEVLRIQKIGDDIHIGCKHVKLSQELEEYIRNKKVSVFLQHGCKSI